MKKILTIIGVILLFGNMGYSQIKQYVKWDYSYKQVSDNEVVLIFKATIDKNWHLYSPYNPKGGSQPLNISYEESPDFELVGKIKESPKPTEEYVDVFGITEKYFVGQATFKQKIKVKNNKAFTIKGTIEGQTCLPDGMCSGFEEDFSFDIKLKQKQQQETQISKPDTQSVAEQTEKQEQSLNQVSIDTTDKTTQVINPDTNKTENDTLPEFSVTDPSILNTNRSLGLIFLISFLAGLLAIFTPCVFPMIPMTVSYFMKGEENKRKSRFEAIVYGISIVLIYTVPIALLIVIASMFGKGTVAADMFNFISTHWLPNILFFIIFMIFAFSFLGAFEIVLPNWMIAKADAKADKGGIWGPFFMAFVLVLVSFSCTGPIVGAVLVESSSGGGHILEPIIAMLGFSIAFAMPFTLFAFFPQWLKKLPKSGGWLNTVKVVLGFIELALGLKFLSVADQTYHWGILDREVYIALWIVIFSMMGFYLLGKLKFAHDSDLPYIKVPRLILAILTFTFVVYLIPGMFGAPLKALSGYLPPQTTHNFDIRQVVRDVVKEYALGEEVQNVSNKKTTCETPKYSDFLHLPHGLEGFFDYEQAKRCAKAQNKPIFIDFTGHGCVNCRKMEENVWVDPEVLKRLKHNYVVVALYVDDKTTLPENEWVTSSYDGKLKKTLGKKYADFQVTRYGVNAQPFYVLIDPYDDSKPLVTPRAYNLDINGFVEFLDKGIEEYNKRHNK